jgi:hypothetical protein
MDAPLPEVPLPEAPVAAVLATSPRRSSGRSDVGQPQRGDDALLLNVDPTVIPAYALPIASIPVPPVPLAVQSVAAQDGGGRQAGSSLSNLPPVGVSSAVFEGGSAALQPPDPMVSPPLAEPFEVPVETARRADVELAAKQDLLPALTEASAPPPPQPEVSPLQQPSHRLEAPASVTSDPRGQSSVTAQIAPVMVSMGQVHDGAHRLTLRLNPVELGLVEIRIDRPSDAPAQVRIIVERPETLTLLLRDQTQLERALDQAGLPPDGRSLSMQVGAVTPPAPPVDSPAQLGHAGAGQADTGANFADGSAGSRDGTPRQDRPGFGSHAPDGGRTETGPIPGRPRWLRAGLDITA